MPYTNHTLLLRDCTTRTSGNGMWSNHARPVTITKLELEGDFEAGFDPNFGLSAVFPRRQWDVDKHGLIYADVAWLAQFRERLVEAGFSADAVASLQFTEHGMQGRDYVSLECGEQFAVEFYASRECYAKRGRGELPFFLKEKIAKLRANDVTFSPAFAGWINNLSQSVATDMVESRDDADCVAEQVLTCIDKRFAREHAALKRKHGYMAVNAAAARIVATY